MRLFVDTSAWLALNDKNDQHHREAVGKGAEIKRRKMELVTSEYVFDEAVTIIRYRVSHNAAAVFGDALIGSGIVTTIDVTASDRLKAWDMFKRYKDKDLSFTDCMSFVLMGNLRIRKAFTFDAHFKQVGFEIF